MHLRSVTPHEILLGTLDEPRGEVTKLGLEFLLASFLQDLFSF